MGCHFLLQRIFPTQGLNPVSHTVGRRFTVWATREVLHIYIYIYLSLTAWGRSCSMQDLHCLMCNLLLQCSDSLVVGHGLSSLWHTGLAAPGHVEILVPWQGIEPITPASQGVFFTTESPRKSLYYCLFISSIFLFFIKLFFKNQHNFFLWC